MSRPKIIYKKVCRLVREGKTPLGLWVGAIDKYESATTICYDATAQALSVAWKPKTQLSVG
jgi:hypothetical protein